MVSFFKRILHRYSKKTIALISVGAVLAIVLIICATLALIAVNSSKIYDGVFVGTIDAGGMTTTGLSTAIHEEYDSALTGSVRLQCDKIEKELQFSDLSAQLDVTATIEQAYLVGRNGNIFTRLRTIMGLKNTPTTLIPVISCDETLLEASLSEIAAGFDRPGKEMHIETTDTDLIITRGIPGMVINIPSVINNFKNSALALENNTFIITPEEVLPTEPDIDKIFAEYCGDPIDASYVIENQQLVITEEKPGIMFDRKVAETLLAEAEGDVISIPITITEPQVTAEQIRSKLFPDLLASYSSKYNQGDVSRSHNVSLASEKINDVVLAPGDVFSYNSTVGPRTAERGFRYANVYVGNRVEPGIGGGICQVSSTLFNTVVLSDLQIVYRTNHSLPVSYVPLGRDATVSYGSIDFKFANSTNHPIKIVASANNGYNTVAIYGVKENPNRSIEITTEQIGSTAYKTVQTEDPTLPVGTVKVEQNGAYGSTYNTYKITKENGSVVKSELLTKSTYVPSDRIELIGTMPVDDTLPEDGVQTGTEPVDPMAPGDLPANAPTETETPLLPVPPNAPEAQSPAPTVPEVVTENTPA